ncbi:NAD(P)-binding protein [Wilcoxina mikolae CBS 423.85]|nr:NAD(P)-binding protein [Wilcoxina mikolae CBS 423.85]
MPFNIVCPSSRGLSLALARALLQRTPHPLIATARKDLDGVKSRILANLPDIPPSRVTVLRVDVTDETTLSAAAAEIPSLHPDEHAHYVFSTPGILYPERSPQQLDKAHIQQTLETNLLGPMLILKHFSQFIPYGNRKNDGEEEGKPAVWANMSARVGSMADNKSGGWYSYRASKAGLNAVTKSFDLHLKQKCGDRAFCVSLHPGTVKTGLSQEFWDHVPPEKLFEPEFAAGKMLDVVMGLGVEDRGKFWDWKGERVEW